MASLIYYMDSVGGYFGSSFERISKPLIKKLETPLNKLSFPEITKLTSAADSILKTCSYSLISANAYLFANFSKLHNVMLTTNFLLLSILLSSSVLYLAGQTNRKNRQIKVLLEENQDKNKPLFLIIQASSDYNNAFSDPLDIDIRLADRFQFKLVKVEDREQVKHALENCSKKISVLCLRAHGDPSGITLREHDGVQQTFAIRDIPYLKEALQKNLQPGAIILGEACSLAKGSHNFAQELSRFATTFGPKEDSYGMTINEKGTVSFVGVRPTWLSNITRMYRSGQEIHGEVCI